MVDDFPNELPPIRSISHLIDLIPGSIFFNKASYKVTPKENEEIRKQVYDLLDKGLVREILIPYVVPTVLSRKKNGGWRMCIDSIEIKNISIWGRFPLPR